MAPACASILVRRAPLLLARVSSNVLPPLSGTKGICNFAIGSSTAASRGDCFDPVAAPLHRLQQVRWKGRNDGGRFANRVRKSTRKQQRKYNLRLTRIQKEKDKHSPPGSRAALRREEEQMDKDALMKDNNDDDGLLDSKNEYNAEDALLDDLMGNTSLAHPTPEPLYLGHRQRHFFNKIADQMEDYRNYQKQADGD